MRCDPPQTQIISSLPVEVVCAGILVTCMTTFQYLGTVLSAQYLSTGISRQHHFGNMV